MRRHLLRKIGIVWTPEGWRAAVIGFDRRWSGSISRAFNSRHMALAAAKAASQQCGLPVIVVETLTAPDGPAAA
jgi:hypothetical protein